MDIQNFLRMLTKLKPLTWNHSCSSLCPLYKLDWQYGRILLFNEDCRSSHFLLEMGRESNFFSLHILEQLQRVSSLAWCDINTFKLRILVSCLKEELITVPFRNSEDTNIITVKFFSTHFCSEVYSSFFSKFLEIQKTVMSHS
jgi:hypothetical protein